jgi:hypothetical protein
MTYSMSYRQVILLFFNGLGSHFTAGSYIALMTGPSRSIASKWRSQEASGEVIGEGIADCDSDEFGGGLHLHGSLCQGCPAPKLLCFFDNRSHVSNGESLYHLKFVEAVDYLPQSRWHAEQYYRGISLQAV